MLRADQVVEGACYTDVSWRRLTVLNMLGASYRIFKPTSVIRRLDALAAIDLLKPRQFRRFSRLIWSLDPPVLDAVRIATCFENLFKAAHDRLHHSRD